MILETGVFVAVLAVSLYVWLTWNYNHWKNMGVPYVEPQLFFGNIKDSWMQTRPKNYVYQDLYRQSSEPALGIFVMRKPQLLIRDPNLAKLIFIQEFSKFRDNDNYVEPTDFLHTSNVFFFSGSKWKNWRNVITPALSLVKMKQFMPQMVKSSQDMIEYLNKHEGQPLGAIFLSGLFTTDTAFSYGYGVDVHSFKDSNSSIKKHFDKIFNPDWWGALKYSVALSFPAIGHFFKIKLTPKSFEDFYVNFIAEAVEYRKKNNIRRNDFLQFVIDESGTGKFPEFSAYDIAGLTMNITGDATHTTSMALGHILDILSRHPKEQAELREEIDSKFNSVDDISYETMNSLSYLNAFIRESLRVRPTIPLLEKLCTTDCEIQYQERCYKFKKGDKIAIPVYAFHMDPELFPEPEDFRPERFLDVEDSLGFMPFGIGPRTCLGKNFSNLQMKSFLCSLLKQFEVLPKEDPPAPVRYDTKSIFFLDFDGGLCVKFKKR